MAATSEELAIYLRAKDGLSDVLGKVRAAFGSTGKSAQESQGAMMRAAEAAVKSAEAAARHEAAAAAVKKLTDEVVALRAAGTPAGEAMQRLSGAMKIESKASTELNRVSEALKKIQGHAQAAKEAMGKIGDALKGIALGAGAALTGLAAGAIKLASDAAGIPQVADSFRNLGGSIEAMREGTLGMVADVDLMKQFNSAAQLVSTDFAKSLPSAMQYLSKVAASTGQDMGFMVESLIKGVGRMSPMILDNLGIQVNLTAANEAYAASLGKSASALTKAEQQTALTNEVMRLLKENTAAMPDVMGSTAQKVQALGTQFANIKDTLGAALVPILQELLPVAQQVGEALAAAFASEGFRTGVQQVAEGISQLLQFLTNLDPAAVAFAATAIGLAVALPKLVTAFTLVKTAVLGLNAVIAANPIGLIAMAIVTAGLGIAAVIDSISKKNAEMAAAQEAANTRIAAGAESYAQYTQRMVDFLREQNNLPANYSDAAIAANALADGIMMSEGAFRSQAAAASLSSDALRGLDEGMLSVRSSIEATRAAAEAPITMSMTDIAGQAQEATQVLEEFKAKAVETAETTGEALAEAMKSSEFTDAVAELAANAEAIMADMEATLGATAEQGASARLGIMQNSASGLQGIMQQHSQSMADMEFNYRSQQAQAEQVYQAQRAALLEYGKQEELAKLDAKHAESQSMSARDHSIQQQMQQRSLIQQKIQQLRAYIEELKNQQDKARQALATKLLESKAFQNLEKSQQIGVLKLVHAGTAAKVEEERKAAEKSAEIAKLLAEGQIEAAKAVALTYAAQAGGAGAVIDEANNQLAKLEAQLANFKLELPPIGTESFDLGLADGGGGGAADAAERATEPATRALSDVVKQVDDGIKAARDAIKNLLEIELPEGVTAGLDRFKAFVKMAVNAVYEVFEDPEAKVKEKIKKFKDQIAPVSETLKLLATKLSIDELGDPPDLETWKERVKAAFTAIMDVLAWADTTYNQSADEDTESNLTKLSGIVGSVEGVLKLAGTKLGDLAAVVDMPMPDLTIWGERVAATVRRAAEVLDWIRMQVPGLAKSAESVESVVNVLKVAAVKFEGATAITEMRWPDLTDWGGRIYAMLARTVEVLLFAKDTLPGLKDGANIVEDVTDVLKLASVKAETLEELVEMRWPDLVLWGARLFAMIERAVQVLEAVRDGLPGLHAATVLVEDVLSVLKITSTKADDVRKLTAMDWPNLVVWGQRLYAMIWEATSVLVKVRAEVPGITDAAKSVDDVTGVLRLVDIEADKMLLLTRMEMPNLAKWSARVYTLVWEVKNLIVRIQETIGDDLLVKAAETAGYITGALDILGTELDINVPSGAGWYSAFNRWLTLVIYATNEIQKKLADMGTLWADAIAIAAPVAKNVKELAELLGVDLEFKVPANADRLATRAREFVGLIAHIADIIRGVLLHIGSLSGIRNEDPQEHLQRVWAQLKETAAIVEPISKLISLLSLNLSVTIPRGNVSKQVQEFAKLLVDIAQQMLTAVQGLANDPRWTGLLDELADAAGQLTDVVGVIDLANLFATIQVKRPAPGQIGDVADKLIEDLKTVTPILRKGLEEVFGMWDVTEGLDIGTAIDLTSDLGDIFGAMEDIAESAAGFIDASQKVAPLTLGSMIGRIKDLVANAMPNLKAVRDLYGEALVGINAVLDQVKALVRATLDLFDMVNSLPDPNLLDTDKLVEIWSRLRAALSAPLEAPTAGVNLTPIAPTVTPLGATAGASAGTAAATDLSALVAQIVIAIQQASRPGVKVYIDGREVAAIVDEYLFENGATA